MAGLIPSFTSGSKLIIHVGSIRFAYATNLSFTDNVSHAPVSGIGSFAPDAIEPLQYTANGSMTLTRYSQAAFAAINKFVSVDQTVKAPTRAGAPASNTERDGNSLFIKNSFSPAHLLISRSFDIDVYERMASGASGASLEGQLSFSIKDVRLTSYSITFTPGTLVQENVTFLALSIVDHAGETSAKVATL
jgi:hypothetical protein